MKSRARAVNRDLLVALIAVLLVSLGAFAYGWYYIIGISSEGNRLETEADNYLQEASKLSDLKLTLAKVLNQKQVVYSAIPKTKETSTALKDFESLAKADGMTISNTNVGDVKAKSKTGSDFSQTVNKNDYYELPIKYEMTGDYANLTKLLADVDVQPRLMSVSDLEVTADVTDKAALGKVRATFILTIYVKK